MIANHIHQALGQVRKLQEVILEKRKFTGYSGTARMLGGSAAMLGCAVMGLYLEGTTAFLVAWGCVLAVGLAVNYGGLALWFAQLPRRERVYLTISPALDALPPLAVGGLLSVALIMKGEPDLLYGTWMSLYGLTHMTCRAALPKENWYLGFYYLACGAAFLLWPGATFANPWPAGAAFLCGEWIGGVIFHRHKIEVKRETDD